MTSNTQPPKCSYTLVPDAMMYVVYDAQGNRRGAFDSEWDAETYMAVLDTTAVVEPDPTPTRRVHYVGDPGCQRTACGRYAPVSTPTLLTTADAVQVTCRMCQFMLAHA